MDAELLLRTDIQDLRDPGWRRRGSRYWVQAELCSDTLFIVEKRAVHGSTARRWRFITADFAEAIRIPSQHSLGECDILMCLFDREGGRRIEPVVEAYAGPTSDTAFVKLASGEAHFVTCAPCFLQIRGGTPLLERT